jgi:hypothetical protein
MTRAARAIQSVLAALCVALGLLTVPAGAGAQAAVHYTKESFQEFERQLNAGQIRAATFNKRIRSLRLTLDNGRHFVAVYPRKQSGPVRVKLEARHVPVSTLSTTQAKQESKSKPTHHKPRYIAGGIVLVIIIVVGAVLALRRRRERD